VKLTRRSVLVSLCALPLAPACTIAPPSDVPPGDGTPRAVTTGGPELDPWVPPQTLDPTAFAWGVQSADATADAVLLGLQTDEPVLGVRVMEATAAGWTEVLATDDLATSDGHLHVEVTGLRADHSHAFVFITPDGRRSDVGRFRTALGEADYRTVVFGASSCLGSAGRPFPTLSNAAEERLDFFCLLGDTVYADGSINEAQYRAEYRQTFRQQGFRDLTASTSLVATWDDHEVDNNYVPSDPAIEARFPAALQVFGEALPYREGPGGNGVWRSLRHGDVLELFVLDCRSERRDGNYMSPEQMDWFKQRLAASTARFKIVLNSVAIQDYTAFFGEVFIEDRWDGYAQRTEIIDWIFTEQIEGIFWIAGDYHFGSLGTVDPPGLRGDHMWEALAGPGGSNPLTVADLFTPNEQVPFFIVDWTWLRVEADPVAGTLALQFIDGDGEIVQERTIEA